MQQMDWWRCGLCQFWRHRLDRVHRASALFPLDLIPQRTVGL